MRQCVSTLLRRFRSQKGGLRSQVAARVLAPATSSALAPRGLALKSTAAVSSVQRDRGQTRRACSPGLARVGLGGRWASRLGSRRTQSQQCLGSRQPPLQAPLDAHSTFRVVPTGPLPQAHPGTRHHRPPGLLLLQDIPFLSGLERNSLQSQPVLCA